MFRHARTIVVLLFATLVIVLGGIGTFTAEAASFKAIINEAQSGSGYGPVQSNDSPSSAVDISIMPGLPY